MPGFFIGLFMRWALGIEYAGTAYCGWQKQHHSPSVQEALELALSKVAASRIDVICAGRTDTGVHAREQVVHFDTDVIRNERAWVLGVNTQLPDDIAVKWAREVPDQFHARYAATARTYRYVIDNSKARPAIFKNCVTWHYHPLNEDLMNQAAQALCGENDFTSFRAQGCQARHPRRYINYISVTRLNQYVFVDIKANAFLHHMVRNIVGSLMVVGREEQPVSWIGDLLALRDRTRAGVTAPASGLYFVKAEYDADYALPEAIHLPIF